MVIKTTPYDVCDYLETEEDIRAYLDEALASNDSQMIALALGNVARKKGMTKIAEEAGLSRESLYKSLSNTGNPELGTVTKVLKALGYSLQTGLYRSDTVLKEVS
jgi:probable addiction module antidote protein